MKKLLAYTNILWIVLAGLLATKLLISCLLAQYGSPLYFYGSRFDALLSMLFYAGMAGWFIFSLIFNKEDNAKVLDRIATIAGTAAGGLGLMLSFIGLIIKPGLVLSLCEWLVVMPVFAAVFVIRGLSLPKKSLLQITAFIAAAAPLVGVIFTRTVAALLWTSSVEAIYIYGGASLVINYILMACNAFVYVVLVFGGYLCFFYMYNAQLNPHSNAPFFNKSKKKS